MCSKREPNHLLNQSMPYITPIGDPPMHLPTGYHHPMYPFGTPAYPPYSSPYPPYSSPSPMRPFGGVGDAYPPLGAYPPVPDFDFSLSPIVETILKQAGEEEAPEEEGRPETPKPYITPARRETIQVRRKFHILHHYLSDGRMEAILIPEEGETGPVEAIELKTDRDTTLRLRAIQVRLEPHLISDPPNEKQQHQVASYMKAVGKLLTAAFVVNNQVRTNRVPTIIGATTDFSNLKTYGPYVTIQKFGREGDEQPEEPLPLEGEKDEDLYDEWEVLIPMESSCTIALDLGDGLPDYPLKEEGIRTEKHNWPGEIILTLDEVTLLKKTTE